MRLKNGCRTLIAVFFALAVFNVSAVSAQNETTPAGEAAPQVGAASGGVEDSLVLGAVRSFAGSMVGEPLVVPQTAVPPAGKAAAQPASKQTAQPGPVPALPEPGEPGVSVAPVPSAPAAGQAAQPAPETAVTQPETAGPQAYLDPTQMEINNDMIAQIVRRPDPVYVARAGTLIDPFKPILEEILGPAQPTEEELAEPEPANPLLQVEVMQLKLAGIAWNPENPEDAIAFVELPDGRSAMLRVGDEVGRHNGMVVEVQEDRVMVEEIIEFSGRKKERTQELKLQSEGD